jgi:pilus assembly protein CpaF
LSDDREEARLRATIRERLLGELSESDCAGGDKELAERVEAAMLREGVLLPGRAVSGLVREISDDLFGLGPLERFARDDTVSEIMVNGPSTVLVERNGRIEETAVSLESDARLIELVRRVIAPLNLRLDDMSPMVDARLPDGSRLNAVLPPISRAGPVVTIRRFRPTPYTLEELMESGTVVPEVASFLRESVVNKANILVSGGASSGKTTMLNMLGSLIPAGERLITIEDAAELRLQHPHVVSLEARPPSIEGRGEVTVRDLVRNSLRMRPDRIIVGEVRGPEALDMLQAMNTGHPGSLGTAHANSALDLMFRLETMVLMSEVHLNQEAVRRQVSSAVDLIVHMRRTQQGRRRVSEVSLVGEAAEGGFALETLFTEPPERNG